MPKKKTPPRPRDAAQLAAKIGAIAVHEDMDEGPAPVDPAAQKRGEARAKALSAKKRSAIAKRAAQARWGKKR